MNLISVKFFAVVVALGVVGLGGCSLGGRGLDRNVNPDQADEAALKRSLKNRPNLYQVKKVLVLPVANRNLDLTAGILLRYFLEKKLASKGYNVEVKSKRVDEILRQVGVQGFAEIAPITMQEIGQTAKVQGVAQVVLLQYSHDPFQEKILLKAKFNLVETYAGRVIWEKEIELEKKDFIKDPISKIFSSDWANQQIPDSEIKALAKSKSGTVPKEAVGLAGKSMPSSKEASRLALEFPGSGTQ